MAHNNNCRTADRNFCAPAGKIAALFVDVDGTMLVCQPYFDQANANFGHFMKLRGFDPEESIKVLRKIDHASTELVGFERDRFGKSIVEAYEHMRKLKRKRFKQDEIMNDRQICENIGRAPFFREPEVFPNTAAVLARAHHNFMIIAVTIGNREAQKYKVRQAGLQPVFDELIITSRDDKPKLVAQVIKDLNIDPHLSAFIGNSKRSDGACVAHTNFIYLPLEPGWDYDKNAELPKSDPFEIIPVDDWRQCEERGINSLVRKRRKLMGPSGPTSVLGEQPCCKERDLHQR